jgi:E3 ubiquitin-protein ligase TRIP12
MFGDLGGFGGFGDIGTGLDSTDGLSAFGATPRQAAEILKKSLPALKSPDVITRKNALSQVAELLISQPEDILASCFPVDAYVTEFVAILSGKPNIVKAGTTGKKKQSNTGRAYNAITAGHTSDEDDAAGHSSMEDVAYDEDAEMARILAMSAADAGVQLDDSADFGVTKDEVESQMFAARCMANMMEALPGSSHTIVSKGGVAVLCAKLREIDYMDLAGQVLCVSTLSCLLRPV